MARFELKLPKMGESVAEATITNWLKQVGDKIEADEAILEIATDKVDSEVPSEVSGVLVEQLFAKDDLVQVGQTIAIIETEGLPTPQGEVQRGVELNISESVKQIESSIEKSIDMSSPTPLEAEGLSDKFFSPLVKNIAKEEGISLSSQIAEKTVLPNRNGYLTIAARPGKKSNPIVDHLQKKTNTTTLKRFPRIERKFNHVNTLV